MFTSLISASIQNNDCTRLEKIPQKLMTPMEKEVVDWLLDYNKRHGQMPTVERFKKTKFGYFFQEILLTTPLDDLLEETIQTMIFNQVESTFTEIRNDHNAGRVISVAPFMELSNTIAASSPIQSRSVGEFDMDDLIPKEGDYIPFGLETFDRASGGINKGETALFFAPTGVGKTTYLSFTAVRAARTGYKVLLITKEMSDVDITRRISAILGNFNNKWFIKAAHDRSFVSKIKAKSHYIKKQVEEYEQLGGDIIIPKARVFTPQDIQNRILEEEHKNDRGFDLILIDGMHRMRPNGSSVNTVAADDWRVMQAVNMQLLDLAQNEGKETRIIATSQCKPGTDPNKSGGFTYEDIGFSKSVVNEASVVGVFSKSDGAVKMVTPSSRIMWAHMLKNRNGEDAAGVSITQLKVNYDLSKLFSGSTNFTTELSSAPLSSGLVVT